MKKKNKYILPVLLSVLLVSCGEDRRTEYVQWTDVNRWIEEVMLENYYWYESMKVMKEADYFKSPEVFFESLLVAEDGSSGNRFSTIESIEEENTRAIGTNEYSFGFEYEQQVSPTSTSILYARVLYVIENSPAHEAGLKRGDWIVGIDGVDITRYNIGRLKGDKAVKLTLGKYDEETNSIVPSDVIINMPEAGLVVENPVYLDTIYTAGNNKKVGYLIYNHFTSGINEGDETYLKELSDISNKFKSNGVSEVILDFRFNPGGTLPAVDFFCSMLIPESYFGKEMYFFEYNDKKAANNHFTYLNRESLKGGSNLNLARVYFLVSNNTAAAAEVVINSLQPYMDIVLIGTSTNGKNVGTTSIRDEQGRYPWILNPVTYKIRNAEEKTFSSITPAYEEKEVSLLVLKELGDREELLLSAALGNIEGTYPKAEEEEESSMRHNS